MEGRSLGPYLQIHSHHPVVEFYLVGQTFVIWKLDFEFTTFETGMVGNKETINILLFWLFQAFKVVCIWVTPVGENDIHIQWQYSISWWDQHWHMVSFNR
jgi:hypothetical protein